MNKKMSREEFQAINWKRPSKYGNKKEVVDGYTFASGVEADRYRELKLLLAAGEIFRLKVHPHYKLYVNHHLIQKYTADFSYSITKKIGKRVVEDVKSPGTKDRLDWTRTKKLFTAVRPELHLVEVIMKSRAA